MQKIYDFNTPVASSPRGVARVSYGEGILNDALKGKAKDDKVAQRMPSISYHTSGGITITDIDPLTGQQRHPYRYFDLEGRPQSGHPTLYQVDTTDPEQRANLTNALLISAVQREAIAPLWEVKTAKLHHDTASRAITTNSIANYVINSAANGIFGSKKAVSKQSESLRQTVAVQPCNSQPRQPRRKKALSQRSTKPVFTLDNKGQRAPTPALMFRAQHETCGEAEIRVECADDTLWRKAA